MLRLQREANAVALAPDGRRAAVGLQAERIGVVKVAGAWCFGWRKVMEY